MDVESGQASQLDAHERTPLLAEKPSQAQPRVNFDIDLDDDIQGPPTSYLCCSFTLLVMVAVVTASFVFLKWYYGLLVLFVGIPLMSYFALLFYGTYLRACKQKPFDPEEHSRIRGAKHIKTKDGRIVEYYVFGSEQPDSKVMVAIHGAGITGRSIKEMCHEDMAKLGLRGIAPSLPGCGFSDAQLPRKIVDWPGDDLEPILAAESVHAFMCWGVSMGSPHAQAVGYHFGPDRCTALGLGVPQCGREVWTVTTGEKTSSGKDVPETPGFSGSPKDEGLTGCNGGFFFAVNQISQPMVATEANMKKVLNGLDKLAKESPNWYRWLLRGASYSSVRGWYGVTCQLMGGHWGDFGFHPRDIKTKNIFLLYAEDDTQQRPEHGEILADIFKQRQQMENIKLVVDVKNCGYDHFSGITEKDIAERSISKCVLEL